MPDSISPRRAGVLAAALLFCVALVQPSSANGDDIPRGPHGAATMEYQQRILDTLLPPFDPEAVPPGFDAKAWQAFIPEDNKMTARRVALGRKLFFDQRLSRDGTLACATCHDVTRGFTDQRPVSEGIEKQTGHRNAPTVLNNALLQTLFWDGRSPSLDHQARLPIINPIEMGMPDHEAVTRKVRSMPEYVDEFEAAYGRKPSSEDVGRALGAFERTLVFMDSPFYRFLRGDEQAISEKAKKGWLLFNNEARCNTCHQLNPTNPLGTDNRFHNVGVSARHQNFESLALRALDALEKDSSDEALDKLALNTELSELGRFMVTRNPAHIGTFRTPILPNIGITPPYMHDGSMKTLWDVMDHYNKGGEPNQFLDGGMEPLALSEEEIDQVVALLFTMTDDRFADQNREQMKRQREIADSERTFRDEAMANREMLPFEERVAGEHGLDITGHEEK